MRIFEHIHTRRRRNSQAKRLTWTLAVWLSTLPFARRLDSYVGPTRPQNSHLYKWQTFFPQLKMTASTKFAVPSPHLLPKFSQWAHRGRKGETMAITGAPARFPAGRRILTYENAAGRYTESSDELTVSSSDSVFGFLEGSVDSTTSSDGCREADIFEEEEEEEEMENSGNNLEDNKKFWENQHHLLQATLCRTTALETGIRSVTKVAWKEIQTGDYCNCEKAVAGNVCRICLMREVCSRLRNAGYNSAICRSKWRSSSDIPSGEHTYIDIIENSSSKKGEVRVIIELNFRAEFEMARASDDYNQLISRLPEVFVGKVERLRALIKFLCTAAKKCRKDKKMHMGPWRKQKYMQAKWFSPCKRTEGNAPLERTLSDPTSKPKRASMLTMALLDMPRKTVAVV